MNENLNSPEDASLRALLREAKPVPALPPRFQQNVWRRIEDADAPAKSDSWLDVLAGLILQPRLAIAAAVALILAGAVLGTYAGTHAARQDAQARYVAAVAPTAIR